MYFYCSRNKYRTIIYVCSGQCSEYFGAEVRIIIDIRDYVKYVLIIPTTLLCFNF